MTILECLQLSAEYLNNKGIESARTNAELLLAHILKCGRLDLYLSYDKPLKDEEVNIYRNFLKRRAQFEPLQYITGEVEFYGIKVKVNPSVLIPRQETEILIDALIEKLDIDKHYTFLDIGTGSGNIAISIAKHFQNSEIITIDKSKEALELAKENARLNSVEEKIKFLCFDIIKEKFNLIEADVIVSNPPYVSRKEYLTLQKEITEYEPADAVTDFEDGLLFYNTILVMAGDVLKKDGSIFFEMGEGQSTQIKTLFEQHKFKNIFIKKDYLDIERVIYGEKI